MTYLDETLEADLDYVAQMEQGSVWLRRSIHRAQGNVALADHLQCHDHFGPSDLIWRRPFQGKHRYPSDPKFADAEAIRMRLEERDRAADVRRVNRDPCPYCGARRDVGCHHSRRVAA